MNDDEFELRPLMGESSQAASRLTDEQLRMLFPLGDLSSQELADLRRSMVVKPIRASRTLFKVGEAPDQAFWLLDGVIQLTDAKETRLEAISAGAQMAMPLPYVVPAVDTAECVVDCRVLCLDRKKLNQILKKEHLDARLVDLERGRLRGSDELFREFEQLREKQHSRIMHQPDSAEQAASSEELSLSVDRLEAHSTTRTAPITGYGRHTRSTPRRPASGGSEASGDRGGQPVGTTDLKRAFDAFSHRIGYRKLGLNVRAECLMQCESVFYEPRETVLHQGDESRHWYLILQGECHVEFAAGDARLNVNRYEWGESFGEDGLVTGLPRNASVIASTNVHLLRLAKEPFRRLLMPHLLRPITADDVNGDAYADSIWIDLRMPSERDERVIEGALEVPWPLMRSHLFPDAEDSRPFIIVAKEDVWARPIAYMLMKYGFNAHYLVGGFDQVPEARLRKRSTNHRPAPGGIVRLF